MAGRSIVYTETLQMRLPAGWLDRMSKAAAKDERITAEWIREQIRKGLKESEGE